MEIACCLALSDALAYHYLTPLIENRNVARLWLIRHKPVPGLISPKVSWIPVCAARPLRYVHMYKVAKRISRRPELRAFVSFNPVPYGLISAWASDRKRQKIHFGFIGSDWYRDLQGPFRKPLTVLLKKGDCITATGEKMRSEMLAAGFPDKTLKILPHTVDLQKFPVADPKNADFDMIFVGSLIRRKKVDVILKAFAEISRTYPSRRLGILGDGPEKKALKSLSKRLGVDKYVTFIGHQTDVVRYLSRSKIIIIASAMEGFPFALIEGMSCGLVPVATPVGTIPDLIRDRENGMLVPINDAFSLAKSLSELLDNPALYKQLRENVLSTRETFDYAHSTCIWNQWLNHL